MAPVAVLVIAFSISNRSLVTLELLPLPFSIEAPVYAVVLAGAVVGFIFGGGIAWISGSSARSRARSLSCRAESAERDARYLQEKVSKLEASAAAASRNKALPAPEKAEAA